MKIILALFVLCLVSGCAANTSNYELVEAESSLDTSKLAIDAQSTSFRVPFEDGRKVWERALLFSEHFMERAPTISSARTSESGIVVKSKFPQTVLRTESERYSYEITQRMEQDAFVYAVEAKDKLQGETPESIRNAKNTARFLEKGQLEATLLAK